MQLKNDNDCNNLYNYKLVLTDIDNVLSGTDLIHLNKVKLFPEYHSLQDKLSFEVDAKKA